MHKSKATIDDVCVNRTDTNGIPTRRGFQRLVCGTRLIVCGFCLALRIGMCSQNIIFYITISVFMNWYKLQMFGFLNF